MLRLGSRRDYWLVSKSRRPRSSYARQLTPASAVRRMRDLAASPQLQRRLVKLLADLGIHCDLGTLDEALERALHAKKLRLYREVPLSPTWAIEEVIPLSDLLEEVAEEIAPEPSWIEVQVVDASGEAVPGLTFALTLPDGASRNGSLDGDGLARVPRTEAGSCEFQLTADDYADVPPFTLMTGERHRIRLPDAPKITIPLRWQDRFLGEAYGEPSSLQHFQPCAGLEALVDGKAVSYGLEHVTGSLLEVSFRVPPGEHDVIVRRIEGGSGPVLYAQRLRIGQPRPQHR